MSRSFANGPLHGWVACHVGSVSMFLALGAALIAAPVTMAAEGPGKGAKVVACTSLALEGLLCQVFNQSGWSTTRLGQEVTG